jgi:hypothetical protein
MHDSAKKGAIMGHQQDSVTVTVSFYCDVYFERQIDYRYGEDADGRRGSARVELVPTHVELHEDVPEPVAGYIKTCAIEQFMRNPCP